MQPVKLYPHQQKAVDELGNGKILCGGVGAGKSLTAMAYFFTRVCGGVPGDFGSVSAPRDVVVITTAKKRDSLDWEDDAVKYGISKDRDSSVGGIQLTVDSWNNIEKYLEVEDAFFIFDEQRIVGSGAWVKAFIKIAKRNQWILLSATPGDNWLDYIPVFVANGWYKNRTEFKREHVIYSTYTKFPKVERYMSTAKLVKYRNHVLVHMPFDRHTTRHVKVLEVEYDKELLEKAVKHRWHVYEDRPLQGVSELFSVMRKIVNSDSSRLEAVSGLLKTHPKLIVFYNFDYELEMLRTIAHTSTPESGTTEDGSSVKRVAAAGYRCGRVKSLTTDEDTGLPTSEDMGLWDTSGSTASPSTEVSTQLTPTTGTPQSSPNFSTSTTSGSDTSDGSSTSGITSPTETLSASAMRTPGKSSTNDSASGHNELVVAEWNGHKHQPIPDSDRWVYLVQYAAGAEGWNCIETDAMVFYSLTYSFKQFQQAKGRIDRLNTLFNDLHYAVLKSKSAIDSAIWKALEEKRSFNERDLSVKLDI